MLIVSPSSSSVNWLLRIHKNPTLGVIAWLRQPKVRSLIRKTSPITSTHPTFSFAPRTHVAEIYSYTGANYMICGEIPRTDAPDSPGSRHPTLISIIQKTFSPSFPWWKGDRLLWKFEVQSYYYFLPQNWEYIKSFVLHCHKKWLQWCVGI